MTTQATKKEVNRLLEILVERIPQDEQNVLIGLYLAYDPSEEPLIDGKVYSTYNDALLDSIPYKTFVFHLNEPNSFKQLLKENYIKLNPHFYPHNSESESLFWEEDWGLGYEIGSHKMENHPEVKKYYGLRIITPNWENIYKITGGKVQSTAEQTETSYKTLALGKQGGLYEDGNKIAQFETYSKQYQFLKALMTLQDNKEMQVPTPEIIREMQDTATLEHVVSKIRSSKLSSSRYTIESGAGHNSFWIKQNPTT